MISMNITSVCSTIAMIGTNLVEGIRVDDLLPAAYIKQLADSHSEQKRIDLASNIIRGTDHTTEDLQDLESLQISTVPLSKYTPDGNDKAVSDADCL